MTIKEQIENDIKKSMLAGTSTLTTTLRTLKSAALNLEVAKGKRSEGLSDEEYIELLAKEAKKRQESAEMYKQGGRQEKADAELKEKAIIEQYLPTQLSDEELDKIITEVVAELQASDMSAMGRVIAEVKARSAGQADGGRIAANVKGFLS